MTDVSKYMDTYVKTYMEKVFYFCLRRTGSETEAEDLSSDIGLAVFAELRRGVQPAHMAAWVWAIARNRYAHWAEEKRRRRAFLVDSAGEEIEVMDDFHLEEAWIHREELSLLRRELAFIARDYRQIVVAFYIDDRSVADIAASLSLPVGTVKSRLFRARAILMEGMHMAREFGKMSYRPENLSFQMNGLPGRNGEPTCYLGKLLDKNILLAAYRTPSTADTLSMELGVALPYMEAELDTLVQATLLVRRENTYETNFYIFSAAAQEKIYTRYREIAPFLTESLIEICELRNRWLEENRPGWRLPCQPEEDMRWADLMYTLDVVNQRTITAFHETHPLGVYERQGTMGHTVRPNDGEWDVLGFEEYGNAPCGTSCCGCIDVPEAKELPEIPFMQYLFRALGQAHMEQNVTYREGQNLLRIAEGKPEETEKRIVDGLLQKGFLREENGRRVPAFCVQRKERMEDIPASVSAQIQEKTVAVVRENLLFYQYIRGCIEAEFPSFLSNREYHISSAASGILFNRGVIVEAAMQNGYLRIPTDPARIRMLGAVLTI